MEKKKKVSSRSVGLDIGLTIGRFFLNTEDLHYGYWPNKKKPKFINVVIKIKTNLSPIKLMQRCLNIEKELGRKRNKKNEPRTCDIDIVDYDQKAIKMNKSFNLNIPHPEMHKRNFVLLPLFEIAKSWIHPVKKKGIKKLLNSLNSKDLRTIKLI